MGFANILKKIIKQVSDLHVLDGIEFFFVAVDTSTENQQVYLVCSKLGGSFLNCRGAVEQFKEHCFVYKPKNNLHVTPGEECITEETENTCSEDNTTIKFERESNVESINEETQELEYDITYEKTPASNPFQTHSASNHQEIINNDELQDALHDMKCRSESGNKKASAKQKNRNSCGSGRKACRRKVRNKNRESSERTDILNLNSVILFDCQKCSRSFDSLKELEEHLKDAHHAELHYKCRTCKRQFRTELRYKLHIHKTKKQLNASKNAEFSGTKDGKSLQNGSQIFPESEVRNLRNGHSDGRIDNGRVTDSVEEIDNVVDGTVCRMCFLKFHTSREREFHENNEHSTLAKHELIESDGTTGVETTNGANKTLLADRVLAVKRHQCKVCSKRFLSAVELRRHSYLHAASGKTTAVVTPGDGVTLKCSECPLLFTNPVYLRNHRYSHFQTAKFKCPECPRRFKRRCQLAEHRNVHRDERPYSCVECGSSFKLESCLRSHSAVHRKDTPHQCSECGKQFKRLASLRQHAFTHGERVYPCTECGKKFAVPHNLRAHVMAVHRSAPADEARNRCDKCGKSFKRVRNLNLHLRSHDPSLMLPCPLCPKRYTRSADLRLHLVSHGDRRPFVCEACHQGFKTPSNLKRHKLIHCRYKTTTKQPDQKAEIIDHLQPAESVALVMPQFDRSELSPQHQQWQELQPMQLHIDTQHQQLTDSSQFFGSLQETSFQNNHVPLNILRHDQQHLYQC